jgi:hypothetical protein
MINKSQGLITVIVFILIGFSIIAGTRQERDEVYNGKQQYQITFGN